jgi:hypothetical protein
VLKLSSTVSGVFPKVLKLSSDVKECKPLAVGDCTINFRKDAAHHVLVAVFAAGPGARTAVTPFPPHLNPSVTNGARHVRGRHLTE